MNLLDTGDCSLSGVFGRCLRSEVEHTGSCQYILLDTLATVMNLLDTGDGSLSGVFCWTLLPEVYSVEQAGNCHVFC